MGNGPLDRYVEYEAWKRTLSTNQTERVVAIIRRYSALSSALPHGLRGCAEHLISDHCDFPISHPLQQLRDNHRVIYKMYQRPGTETRVRYWRMRQG